jgi:hypothetical protein
LKLIRGYEEKTYDLCKLDRNTVMTEAHSIKACSSNYFIWSIGLLFPLLSAVWTLALQDRIDASACSGAMLSIFFIFCMSAFSNLEKTRAIYKREGFVAALDTYLFRGETPQNYKGWINLKYNFAECVSKRSAKACPKHLDKDSKEACKYIGEKNAQINEYKKVVPSILDSFISLTSVFYSILYTIILILMAISIARMFSTGNYNLSVERITIHFAIGFIIGFFILGRNARILFIVIFLTFIAFIVGAINPNASLPIGRHTVSNIYIVLVSEAFGFIIGSIGNILAAQIITLRIKQYSVESQFYMWLEIFEKCLLMPDYEIKNEPNKSTVTKIFENVRDWMFFGKPSAPGLNR